MTIKREDRFIVIRRTVASRTRTKLGSPVHQTRPVQYPQKWLPNSSGSRKDKRLKSAKIMTAPTVHAKEGSAENDCDGLDPQQRTAKRRFSGLDLNNDLFRLEESHRARRQKANTTKRLKSSLIQLVEYKTRTMKKKRQIKKPRPTRIRIPDRRGIKRRSLEGRVARRRRVMRGRTRRRRVAVRRRAVRRRRRRVGLTPRKRRRRKRRESEDSYHRRAETNPGPSLGHENDHMLSEQAKVVVSNLDEGHDEVRDDPLNVNDICRTLVKSMHGTPADCREVTTKGKNDKPELQRGKKEGTQRDRRPKPEKGKRRTGRRADDTAVSNNRRHHRKSRRDDKKLPKRRKKGEDVRAVKSREKGNGKTAKKVNDDDESDEEDMKDSHRADRSHRQSTSRQAQRRRSADTSHSKGRSPATVDREGEQSRPNRCSHQALYKNRTKKPHAHSEKQTEKRGNNKKTVAVGQGTKKDKIAHKKSTNGNNSGDRSKNAKSDTAVESDEQQGNQNNNQDTDVRWYRVGGRLKRVTRNILSRLKRFFVK